MKNFPARLGLSSPRVVISEMHISVRTPPLENVRSRMHLQLLSRMPAPLENSEKEEYEERQKAMEKVVNPIFSSLYQEGGSGSGEGGDSAGDDDEESHDEL